MITTSGGAGVDKAPRDGCLNKHAKSTRIENANKVRLEQ